jgi:hypothetical protein
MIYSDKLDKIASALAKAQSEMAGAVKGTSNTFFKSNYADLKSVWIACKEALHSNDLSVIQSPINSEGRIGVTTLLLHSSGQYIQGTYTLGVKKQNDPQADGSSITYARRYALAAFVGVCPADDDAEAAMMRGVKETINADQVENINKLISDSGADKRKFLVYYKVKRVEDIPVSLYKQCESALTAKKGA